MASYGFKVSCQVFFFFGDDVGWFIFGGDTVNVTIFEPQPHAMALPVTNFQQRLA
jgi:hypothetical protein